MKWFTVAYIKDNEVVDFGLHGPFERGMDREDAIEELEDECATDDTYPAIVHLDIEGDSVPEIG
jgi:hypothetical protein